MLQKAYNEDLPLVGPESTVLAITSNIFLNLCTGDPDGWHTLAPLTVQGKLFDSHAAEVTFKVSDHLFLQINKANAASIVGACKTRRNIPFPRWTARSERITPQADLWQGNSYTALADAHSRQRASSRPSLHPQGNQTSPRSFLGHRFRCNQRHRAPDRQLFL